MQLTLKKTENRNTWYLPACARSKLLFKLMKRKGLKEREVQTLRQIGFTIN